MFKCTDCEKEYEIRPDYCDCGNDVFEEVVEDTESHAEQAVSLDVANENVPQLEPKYKSQVVAEDEQQQINFPQSKDLRKIDWVSVPIFILCLVLSVLIWCINPKSTTENDFEKTPSRKPLQQKSVDVPSVDKLWKDAPQATISIPETESKQKIITAKPDTSIKTVANSLPQPVKKPQSQIQPQKKVVAPVNKPINTVSQTVSSKPTQPIQNSQSAVQTKLPPGPNTVSQAVNAPSVAQKPYRTTAQYKSEMLKYKIALRNKLVSNMDFTKIVGDGSCTITFNVAPSGMLINRKFAQQSPNNSLNDVVFAAMLKNPNFNPPPQDSEKELYTLKVQIYGGNFEVDLR